MRVRDGDDDRLLVPDRWRLQPACVTPGASRLPLLVLVDWLFIGRAQTRVRWWWPLVWIVGPLAYLALYIQGASRHGVWPYSILIVGSADFWPTAVVLFSSFVPLFFVVWGAPRLLRWSDPA